MAKHKSPITHKMRVKHATKDLELKLKCEASLETMIQRPLQALYTYICKNRKYEANAVTKDPAFLAIRKGMVDILIAHYKGARDTFKRTGFIDYKSLNYKAVEQGVDDITMALFQRRAEEQADIIIGNSFNRAKAEKDKLVAVLVARYVLSYVEELDEESLADTDNTVLLLMLGAMATRSAIIALVETQYAGEITKLVEAARVRDVRRREAAGEITAGQAADDIASIEAAGGKLQGLIDAVEEQDEAPGKKTIKEWNAVMDNRTRKTHAEADGQTQEIDQPFIVGGYKQQFPGDTTEAPIEETINCRCEGMYYEIDA